jgi:hypothetical protein
MRGLEPACRQAGLHGKPKSTLETLYQFLILDTFLSTVQMIGQNIFQSKGF